MGRKTRKIPQQEYTAEFKELVAKRVKSDQTVGMVTKHLGLIEQTRRNRVKAVDAGEAVYRKSERGGTTWVFNSSFSCLASR